MSAPGQSGRALPEAPHSDASPRPDLFWGMALFLITDAVMFLLLLVANIYLRRYSHGPAQDALETGVTAWFSLALWGSSGTLVLAELVKKRSSLLAGGLYLLTAVLGGTFVAGQLHEYLGLLDKGVRVHSDLFFTGFFALTGLHGLHVIIGLPLLTTLGILTFRKKNTGAAPSAISLYWHFVDAVWVVLFTALYLWRGP